MHQFSVYHQLMRITPCRLLPQLLPPLQHRICGRSECAGAHAHVKYFYLRLYYSSLLQLIGSPI
jgi:hypothetical protein